MKTCESCKGTGLVHNCRPSNAAEACKFYNSSTVFSCGNEGTYAYHGKPCKPCGGTGKES